MSKLQSTVMLEWRRRSNTIYAHEFESKLYGAMNLFLDAKQKAGALLTDQIRNDALRSAGNTIKIPVLKTNASAAVGSARSCTIPNNETDSALVELSWTTITDGFHMFPTRYLNNEIEYQQHFDANMNDMVNRIAKKIDQLCLANLSANKTAVLNDSLLYTFNGTTHTIEAALADRMDLVGDLNAIMLGNNFRQGINIVGNAGVLNTFNKLAEHDTYNDVNKRYEYADKALYLTHQLANESGKYATMYAVADNQVDILSRVSRSEAMGVNVGEEEFGITYLPLFGQLPFGFHFRQAVGDQSTATGESDMVCDPVEQYGFSIDIALVNAYNSDTANTPTGIVAATIANN